MQKTLTEKAYETFYGHAQVQGRVQAQEVVSTGILPPAVSIKNIQTGSCNYTNSKKRQETDSLMRITSHHFM